MWKSNSFEFQFPLKRNIMILPKNNTHKPSKKLNILFKLKNNLIQMDIIAVYSFLTYNEVQPFPNNYLKDPRKFKNSKSKDYRCKIFPDGY